MRDVFPSLVFALLNRKPYSAQESTCYHAFPDGLALDIFELGNTEMMIGSGSKFL